MKTPEEIKKGLACCVANLCEECPYFENGCPNIDRDTLAYIEQLERSYDVHRGNIELLNRYIAELNVHQYEWVSVKDRLPRVAECRFLVCLDDGFIATAIWDNGWELWADAGEVTHWMPLPKPPKEGE